jgi:hypothetical protein
MLQAHETIKYGGRPSGDHRVQTSSGLLYSITEQAFFINVTLTDRPSIISDPDYQPTAGTGDRHH